MCNAVSLSMCKNHSIHVRIFVPIYIIHIGTSISAFAKLASKRKKTSFLQV